MKEVKFRGKDIETEEIICGSLVIDEGIPYIFTGKLYFAVDDCGKFCGMRAVEPESIEIYMGERDENGREIYHPLKR